MIELFRDPDSAKVGFYQSILEEAGIKTHIRNADGSNMAEVMIPDVYPALCILHESDLDDAKELIRCVEQSADGRPEKFDKPRQAIYCAIFLFGPLFIIGLVGLFVSLFGDLNQEQVAPSRAKDTSSVMDVSDINEPSVGFKVFASSLILLLGAFGLFNTVRLVRRSLVKNIESRADNPDDKLHAEQDAAMKPQP